MSSADNKSIEELYTLIEKIETAMLTTRRPDGSLVSRPMSTQKRDAVADFWFVTDIESDKSDELEHDPNVNLGYFNAGSYEWVSVSGEVTLSTDREQIRRLYQPDWKMWFGKVDEIRDGGPDDPRLALILVHASTVMYMKRNKSAPVVWFELAKGMLTGSRPDIGDVKKVAM